MSMTDRYQEKSEAFFDELARSSYDNVRGLFLEMMRECALRCACEVGSNPTAEIGKWAAGRISICSEWTDGVEGALARLKEKASSEKREGFAYPPI